MLKNRPNLNAVSAVMGRAALTMSLMRLGGTVHVGGELARRDAHGFHKLFQQNLTGVNFGKQCLCHVELPHNGLGILRNSKNPSLALTLGLDSRRVCQDPHQSQNTSLDA